MGPSNSNARGGAAALFAGPTPLLVSIATLLAGLIAWAVTILQARASTTELFNDMGVTIDSIAQLEQAAGVGVGIITPLLAVLIALNAYFRLDSLVDCAPEGPSAERRRAALPWLAAANNAAILVSALALAAAAGWLVDMRLFSQAAAGGGGRPYLKPADAKVPAAAVAANVAASAPGGNNGGDGGAAATNPVGFSIPCPPGCIDFGPWASLMGLPWHCLCLPGFLMKKVAEQADRAVGQLWVAAAGGALMVLGASWLCMLSVAALAAAPAAAAAAHAGGGSGAGASTGPGLAAAREPLLPGGGRGGASRSGV